ncbi:MAG TPA: DNA polymerase I [Bacilli bacterium]|nr:DNA polymerase I [Bacilli bacterium]
MKHKLHIIDGNSLLFRAYYATAAYGEDKIMRTKEGIPTNALMAFANMIQKILSELEEGDYIFVPFDTGEKTFRHDAYADYKGTRREVPELLITQFPLARDFLDALKIKHDEIIGYEADDLAGTVAKLAEKEGIEVIIHTSDQDYFQLISDLVTIRVPKPRGAVLNLTPSVLMEEYHLKPEQVTSYKGLVGDASDNLPGVPGVGKKTAERLLKEYGSLDNILNNAHGIKGKLGFSLRDHAHIAKNSKFLATLKTDIPLSFTLKDLQYFGFDFNTVHDFAAKYELNRFMRNLEPFKKASEPEEVQVPVTLIENTNDLTFNDELSLNVILTSDNYFTADVKMLYFSLETKVYKMSAENLKKDTKLQEVLADMSIKKRVFDFKKTAIALSKIGLTLNGFSFDFLLAAYLLDSNTTGKEEDVLRFFGYSATSEADHYSALLVLHAQDLESKMRAKLAENNLLTVYENIEAPLVRVLMKMELVGFPLDEKILNEIGDKYKVTLENLRAQVSSYTTQEINVNSPQQIAVLLYDELGLKGPRNRSTSVDVLEKLKDKHPVIEDILEYRKYAKIISTYIDGLIPHIHEDGKVHTIFNQALTTTGRLSSKNPNLQNISVRDEVGREIRKAFYYENSLILSLDYSQIELRLLAAFAQETKLITIFNEGHDIHSETAKALFPLEDADNARRKAKAVNFGIVYGISDWGLAEQLKVEPKESRLLIEAFFKTYPELLNYREKLINDLMKDGYVETFTGRRRLIPEINDPNYQRREFAKRAAMNAPLQGGAADIIKLAMIKVDEFLVAGKYKSKLILQIHDELLFELHPDELFLIDELKKIMENVVTLDVKLKVDSNYGKDWFEAT